MKKLISAVLVITLALGLVGCATQAGTGAGVGATLGALAGAVLCKGKADCIVAGAAIGGVAGLAVGAYLDKQVADRKAAVAEYESKPASDGKIYISGGTIRKDLLEMEKSEVNPAPVQRGSEFATTVQYTVISRNADEKISVVERRYIIVDGDSIDICKPRTIQVEQGTRASAYKVKLPDGFEDGNYDLVTEVSGLGQTKKIITVVKVAG
ncbi:MAG: hypothetical protein M0024_10580 [Nitrospiraceae bacterium]|nr:hypothetical protein [Nitrospiraceae bacterium]